MNAGGVRLSRAAFDSSVRRTVYATDRHATLAKPDDCGKDPNMAREYDVIIERDSEGYFVATVPALKGCHTQAKSLDELKERVKEAVALCIEVEGPAPVSLEFIGLQRVRIA